ncbi:hypothetical protein Smp_123900 [Schistosoma mansoni]|uniref:hypothetical protein n=1 Tax=Schistosoma mansoni TaxID=6183 RepID=UPI0001A63F83|nr:hypothetical protein Smp_123900 [Schistosoma mansoni]|eukprot:XP_018647694.1 hypothetical protein Smp_123900 [Schistosoma mansoni]
MSIGTYIIIWDFRNKNEHMDPGLVYRKDYLINYESKNCKHSMAVVLMHFRHVPTILQEHDCGHT